jgi:hypothetical protein
MFITSRTIALTTTSGSPQTRPTPAAPAAGTIAGGDRDREREQARRDERRHLVEPGDDERGRDERALSDDEAYADRAEEGNAETEQL